jgi:hypothetical protein
MRAAEAVGRVTVLVVQAAQAAVALVGSAQDRLRLLERQILVAAAVALVVMERHQQLPALAAPAS